MAFSEVSRSLLLYINTVIIAWLLHFCSSVECECKIVSEPVSWPSMSFSIFEYLFAFILLFLKCLFVTFAYLFSCFFIFFLLIHKYSLSIWIIFQIYILEKLPPSLWPEFCSLYFWMSLYNIDLNVVKIIILFLYALCYLCLKIVPYTEVTNIFSFTVKVFEIFAHHIWVLVHKELRVVCGRIWKSVLFFFI